MEMVSCTTCLKRQEVKQVAKNALKKQNPNQLAEEG